MRRLGSEKVPYVTTSEHPGMPAGTECLVSRRGGQLVAELPDGTEVEIDKKFYAAGLEDPILDLGHEWVLDADRGRSVNEEGKGYVTMSVSIMMKPDGEPDVIVKSHETHWRCTKCGMCVTADDPDAPTMGGNTLESCDSYLTSSVMER